jgi:hypothetical protein
MALQLPIQIYRGLLKNLADAVATTPGVPLWTTDSQELYVSDGGSFARAASDTKVWTVATVSALRTTIPAAGGHALLGDIVVNTGNNSTYLLTGYANSIWQAATEYVLGDSLIDANGNLQTVTTAGTSSGTEPSWNTSGTTADNGVTWTESEGFVVIASASGGGGGTYSLQVEVNFGPITGENSNTSVTVTGQSWVATDSVIIANPFAGATDDHSADEVVAEGLTAYIENVVAGVGFDVVAYAPNGTWGDYFINVIGM